MFKQETSLRCEDEDTNEEWYWYVFVLLLTKSQTFLL
jgi:hypothetical protein